MRLPALICLAAIAIGPCVTDPGYDWVRHSVSELAGQDTRNAWLMRVGLVALGGAAVAGFFRDRARFNPFFLVFGVAIALTAVFPHCPFDPRKICDTTLDRLHSFFASLGGFSAVMAFAFLAGSPGRRRERIEALILALAFAGLSAAMFVWPYLQGVFQRAIFLSFIAWLLVTSVRLKRIEGARHR